MRREAASGRRAVRIEAFRTFIVHDGYRSFVFLKLYTEDGLTGIQQLSHDATLLFYMSEEGQEGRNSFQEGRQPDFSKYPRRP